MKYIRSILLGFTILGSLPFTVLSDTIVIQNSVGESIEMGIGSEDRFLDVLNQIQAYFQEDALKEEGIHSSGIANSPLQWNLSISHAGLSARAKKQEKRDFNEMPTKKDREDIAFIVTTLAFDSLVEIGKQRSALKEAGDRIAYIHPFHFLSVIFTSERLKAGIQAIDGRTSWVKKGFFDGITETLTEEADRNNVLPFVDKFAERVNIKAKQISPALEKRDWKGFVKILMEEIPRETDPNRYDM